MIMFYLKTRFFNCISLLLFRPQQEYIDSYKGNKGGKRAMDLWASVPDDTSNLQPFADELATPAPKEVIIC